MPGTPQVNVSEATGSPPLPSNEIAYRAAIIAPAYTGTLEPRARYRVASVATDHTAGPLVRHSQHLFARTKRVNITVRCVATNPGVYDAIDVTAKTGTCVPTVDASVVPRDAYEAYWVIVEGGEVATDGITYRESDDGGRHLSGLKRLGTSTVLQFATQGIRVNLDPPLAPLLAFVNEIVDETEDHFALVGSVHGSADAGPYTIAATATTQDEAIARFNQVIAAAKLHVVKVSGAPAIHGAADTDAQTALNAIDVPTTGQSLITAALAFKMAFFGDGSTVNSGHTLRTASTIHGATDVTNVPVEDNAARGTLIAGDIILASTEAPFPSADELADAFSALVESDLIPGCIVLPWRVTPAYAGVIRNGLDSLAAVGKPCWVAIQARKRDDNTETFEQHRTNVETEWRAVDTDSRMYLCIGDYLCGFTNGAVDRTYLAGFTTQAVRKALDVLYYETTWKPLDGSLRDVAMTDANGVLIGHDEPQNVETKAQVMTRTPAALLGRPQVLSVDYVLSADDERIKELRARRITDELHRYCSAWAWGKIGTLAAVENIANGFGTLKEEARALFQREFAAIIQANMAEAISDTDAPDLVEIDPIVAVSGANVTIAPTVNYTPIGAVERVDITLAVRTQ